MPLLLRRTPSTRLQRGIVQSAEERGIELLPLEDFRAIPGKGVEARIAGTPSLVVSPGYLSEAGIPVGDERVATAESQGKTGVFLLEDQKLLGALALADITGTSPVTQSPD